MTHTFKLARRTARFRAPMLVGLLAFAFGACDSADQLTNPSTEGLSDPTVAADSVAPTDTTLEASVEDSLAREDSLAQAADPTGGLPISDEDEGVGVEEEMEGDISVEVVEGPDPAATAAEGLSLANASRGGIPFGTFHLPKSLYGSGYTGSLANISPSYLRSYLETARRTGTKVIVTFAGNERHYKNSNRSFSLTKWKQRVSRYRGINLSSYINDGTLMGHYILDEPHDPSNWGGRLVSRATLDEMARYSKQIWPRLPTVVRSWPKYLKGYNYRYLDAAWAQYSARFGAVSSFMSQNVRDAKASGLALVIGMNLLAGGNRSGLKGYYSGKYSMSASQLRSWGGTMLSNSYPCAFLSWQYNSKYLGRSDIKSAKTYLAGKARARSTKSCRGS